ncbi:MAG: translation initiation factor IF-2 N-terminal domain-containing protein, partial [Oscillospiraceae bacterium]|nr:translation initiation factor IF-2 N-terminal domain-containing protein [Oscillospiraceae bacterium]
MLMAMMVKYRIHEVAKDFNTTSKVISQILTDYIAAPKNHMQVLDTPELDVIFEYMTQHNQAESLEEIFRSAPPAEPQKETAEAKKPEAAAPAKAGKAGAGKQAA